MNVVWGGYRINTGENDQPLSGVKGVIVKRFGIAQSGYDCLVRSNARECAEAFVKAGEVPNRTVEDWLNDFKFQEWMVGDDVELEANEAEELVVANG